jgi:hypothetical protein
LVSLDLSWEAVKAVAITFYLESVESSIDDGDINSRRIATKLLNDEIAGSVGKAGLDLFYENGSDV